MSNLRKFKKPEVIFSGRNQIQ